ncbi:hypothetical protein ACLBR5_06120 [Escherichia coli]
MVATCVAARWRVKNSPKWWREELEQMIRRREFGEGDNYRLNAN